MAFIPSGLVKNYVLSSVCRKITYKTRKTHLKSQKLADSFLLCISIINYIHLKGLFILYNLMYNTLLFRQEIYCFTVLERKQNAEFPLRKSSRCVTFAHDWNWQVGPLFAQI